MPSLPEVHASIPVPSPGSPWTKKFGAFVGVGFMISVGYIDPGNWATDLTGEALQLWVMCLPEPLLHHDLALFTLQVMRPGSVQMSFITYACITYW